MKRRKFTIGLGALATGSAAALGTGAFSSVEADRQVQIDVADDANAFLRFEGDDDYVTNDNDGTLTFDLGGAETDAGGQAFNDRARTEVPDIIDIRNQGTQDVNLGFGNTPSLAQEFGFEGDEGDNDSLVTLFVEGDSDGQDPIGAGDEMSISVVVDNRDDAFDDTEIEPGDATQSVQLTAFEPDEFPDFPEDGDDGFQ